MSRITVTRKIAAPIDQVFRTVSNIEGFSRAVADILKVEFLTEKKVGVGTRFKETRKMGGREASTILEVTEYVEDERVRLVTDTFGTIWDSVFTVRGEGDVTVLDLTMDAKPYKLLPRLLNPLMKGGVTKALTRDMDAVKAHCEK